MVAARANSCAFCVIALLSLVVLMGNVGGQHSAAEAVVKSGVLGPVSKVLKKYEDEQEVQEGREAAAMPREERVALREERVAENERSEEAQADAERPAEAAEP